MKTIERILATAELKNIKQADIAKAIGKGTSQITNWKNRNSDPPVEHLPAIAQLLNVSLEWLITGTEKIVSNSPNQPDEQQLLQYYNRSNPEGKERIMEQAEFISSKYPENLGKSSNYKIG